MPDTRLHRFTARTGIPCPRCDRWLPSWVMLGIHLSGHVKADEIIQEREERKKKPARMR